MSDSTEPKNAVEAAAPETAPETAPEPVPDPSTTPPPRPRVKTRMVARVRAVGVTSLLFRRTRSKVKLRTTEGLVTVHVPRTEIEGNYVRLRVASLGEGHVTCILPGKQLVAFRRNQVSLEER